MHSEKMRLDVSKELYVERIYLRVGEGGLTTFDATIEDNGQPYDLTGCSVLFLAYDQDLKVIYENARIVSAKQGQVQYTVSNRLTNMAGKVREAYFRIQNGTNQITTQNIPIVVLKNVDLDGEQAEEYTSQFEQLLADIQSMMADVNGALNSANAATQAANDAATAANSASSNFARAEASRVASEGSREVAETSRVNAEAARETAERLRSNAEDSREAAEEQRVAAEAQRVEEWDQIKEEATTATEAATTAADAANEAADRVDEAIDSAEKATARANTAAARNEQVYQDVTYAAGRAEIAASVSNAATDRLNTAMESFNSIMGTEISYAAGSSSTVPPTSGWTAAQQPVPQGQFQWVRTITHWYKGADTVAYSIAHQGVDGRDGITTQINGLYWFDVEEDNLVVFYHDEDNPPEFELEDGILYALYETEG